MNIENFKIESIIPYEFNSKVHDEDQVNKIANSIKEFGFNQPLVIDENNIIVVGHGRYQAAKKLELKEVPCLKILDLNETKKRAYRILDNKINESSWDFKNLSYEFPLLKAEDLDFDSWGLTELELHLGNPDESPYDTYKDDETMQDMEHKKIVFRSLRVHCQTLDDWNNLVEKLNIENSITENTKFIYYSK